MSLEPTPLSRCSSAPSFGGDEMKNSIIVALAMALLTLPVLASPNSPRTFKNWQECFRFMAGDSDTKLQPDDNVLFKLAAESSMDWFWLEEGTNRTVIVIKLEYLKRPYSALRGAQGNGLYYLFLPVQNGLRFVGRMEGNGYKWGTRNGKARFTTASHMSASEAFESVYDWDGTMFRETSHTLFKYEPDGTRKEIRRPNKTPENTARKLADPQR